MDTTSIIPISGDHFEDFMLLTNPEHKSSRTKQAWQALRQQIQAHVPSSLRLDLNRICVDTIRMELLIFPVVEHWKRPLTNAEWAHIENEAKQLEQQMEKLRKLSSLVRKKIHSLFLSLHHYSINYLSTIRSYAKTGVLSKVRGRTTRRIGSSSKPKKAVTQKQAKACQITSGDFPKKQSCRQGNWTAGVSADVFTWPLACPAYQLKSTWNRSPAPVPAFSGWNHAGSGRLKWWDSSGVKFLVGRLT